ncbi:serum response factor homolog [Bacillus rossius redtenbacheri]|uniref:serum response factor homolog n=1 Tax=Bacillus rossius redtenbacheri TaxID=93214 RepID=UPI002FDE12EE
MDTPPGGGRDSRFNMGYNMSLLSGEGATDIYGNAGHSSRPSTSISSGVPRPTLSLPTSCAGLQRGVKRTSSDVYLDQEVSGARSGMSSHGGLGLAGECGAEMGDTSFTEVKKSPPANGKKTKGRVKIKMEYIDNKLRRYTTFSKRKTGIMKKAYELSTLTGTQVMLLVASETGHVYTFATRKLQPMITSEAGKALIQTCLNSPDPPAGGSSGGDQRMSATGFEETELTYNIGDEEQKEGVALSPRSEAGGESADSSAESAAADDPDDSAAGGVADVSKDTKQAPSPGPAPQPQLVSGSLMGPPYPRVMYQTAQGMVYAAPTPALPNGVIFSLAQGTSGTSGSTPGHPQYVTIPFPVAITAAKHQVAADLSVGRK